MSSLDDAISEVSADSTPTNVSPLDQAIHEVHADAGAPSPVADPSLWDKYLGFQESQLAGATGGVGSLAGGLGYLGNLAAGGTPEQAEAMRQRIASDLTYSPKTEEGKKQTAAMGEAAGMLGQTGGEKLGSAVMDVTGSPALATAANVAVNIPQFLVGAKGAGKVGEGLAEPIPPTLSTAQDVLQRGQEKGLVVSPSTVNPSIGNKLTEGAVGKLSTAQAASIKNQPIFDSLARQDFGLSPEDDLSPETMARIRSEQSPAYDAVKAVPEIKFGPEYNKELSVLTKTADKITSELPDFKATGSEQVKTLVNSIQPPSGTLSGESAVELSKTLRNEASSYYDSANRTGSPSDKALAAAYRGSATAVENAIENHLTNIGKPELAANWDNARTTIAKTYSLQDALDGAGHVDVSKLAKQSIKGKPLSDNLDLMADWANNFPKSSNLKWSKESVPGLSPLDVYGGSALGLASAAHQLAGAPGHAATAGTIGAAALGAAIPVSRMVGRSAILSGPGQRLMTRPSVPTPGSIATPLGQAAVAGMPTGFVPDKERKENP